MMNGDVLDLPKLTNGLVSALELGCARDTGAIEVPLLYCIVLYECRSTTELLPFHHTYVVIYKLF